MPVVNWLYNMKLKMIRETGTIKMLSNQCIEVWNGQAYWPNYFQKGNVYPYTSKRIDEDNGKPYSYEVDWATIYARDCEPVINAA